MRKGKGELSRFRNVYDNVKEGGRRRRARLGLS